MRNNPRIPEHVETGWWQRAEDPAEPEYGPIDALKDLMAELVVEDSLFEGERDLLKRMKNGEDAALNELCERCRPYIQAQVNWRIGDPWKGQREDLVQEVLIRFAQKRDEFEIWRPLKPWIGVLCKTVCGHFYERVKTQKRFPKGGIEPLEAIHEIVPGRYPAPCDIFDRFELAECIKHIIQQRLSTREQVIFAGRLINRRHDDIARDLQMTSGAVRTALVRIRKRLKNALLSDSEIRALLTNGT